MAPSAISPARCSRQGVIGVQGKVRLNNQFDRYWRLLGTKVKEKQNISDAANYDDRPKDFRIGVTPAHDSLQHGSVCL
jgi:hypothetical protein